MKQKKKKRKRIYDIRMQVYEEKKLCMSNYWRIKNLMSYFLEKINMINLFTFSQNIGFRKNCMHVF